MSSNPSPEANEQPIDRDQVAGTGWLRTAAEQAGRRAVSHHHREGRSVVTLEGGRILYHHPDGSMTTDDQTPDWAKSPSAA